MEAAQFGLLVHSERAPYCINKPTVSSMTPNAVEAYVLPSQLLRLFSVSVTVTILGQMFGHCER